MEALQLLNGRNISKYGLFINKRFTRKMALDRLDRSISEVTKRTPELERKIINFPNEKRVSDGIHQIYDEFDSITNYEVDRRSKRLLEINEMTIRFLDRHHVNNPKSNKYSDQEYPYFTDRTLRRIYDEKEFSWSDVDSARSRKSTGNRSFGSFNYDDKSGSDGKGVQKTHKNIGTHDFLTIVPESSGLLVGINELDAAKRSGNMNASDKLSDLIRAIELASLTPSESTAIRMRFVDKLDQDSIAYELDVSQSAVSKRLQTALRKIDRIFDAWNEMESDRHRKIILKLSVIQRKVYNEVILMKRPKSIFCKENGITRHQLAGIISEINSKI